MAVGPQAPPGTPPRPRQVIIPAGTVDENDTTVLDVPPGSPLEQPQRVIIPPGTVHADETMVVVVPAPRVVASPPRPDAAAAAAAAAAERERREAAERVRNAKLAYAEYLSGRQDREAERLRRILLYDLPPTLPFEEYSEAQARRAERDLWESEMPEIPDIDDVEVETQPYRLQMSMNIEEFPPSAAGGPASYQGTFSSPLSNMTTPSFSSPPPQFDLSSPGPPSPPSPPAWTRGGFDEMMGEYSADLSDIEPPDSFYGEDADWEPPPPPPPLIAPPPDEENIIPMSPPRYVYQRPAPHDPGDLMWDWDEPPRPVFEMPLLPEPEPYSAELFRLVRL